MKKLVVFLLVVAGVFYLLWKYWQAQEQPMPPVPVETIAPITPPEVPPVPPTPPPPPPVLDVGENAVVPGKPELYATYSAVGIELPYTGDANTNATASFVWRETGAERWRNGVDMTFDRTRRLVWASIWPLRQDTEIEVSITFADPDPMLETIDARVRTPKMVLETSGGRTLWVSADKGNDTNPGTQDAPLQTIGAACVALKAGDTVYVMSGVYREGVHLGFGVKAREGQPIVIAAAPDQEPIMDGGEEIPRGSDLWEAAGGGVYFAPADFREGGGGYVAQDGMRMYRYKSLEALQADEYQAKRCWFYDDTQKRLYVRTGTELPPARYRYDYAVHEYGFYVEGCKYVVIRGFTMRNYGAAAIRVSGTPAEGNVIYGNKISNAPNGIFFKGTKSLNAIWNNEVFEPGLSDFGWDAIKRSDYGRQGIMVWYDGRGASICYNDAYGWFDCIVVESWRSPDNLALNRDSDVMFNNIWNAGDDGMELDGGGVNMRIHANRMRNTHSAISLAPVERGPVYCTRNDGTYRALFFKLSVGAPSEGWTYCYHNSGYAIDQGNEATMLRFNDKRWADSGRVFKNNAMIGSEWAVHRARRTHELDYNCYFNTPAMGPRKFMWEWEMYPTLESFQRDSGLEKHGMYEDPKFTSTPDLGKFAPSDNPLYDGVTVGDMTPTADSPLIDRGTVIRGINEEFRGRAPDIGAFETGG